MTSSFGHFHNLLRSVVAIGCGMAGVFASGLGNAQSVDQTLDKIDVFSSSAVLGVKQTPLLAKIDYYLNVSLSTNFKSCQGTGTRGLYCLDGNAVVRFPNPDELFEPGVSRENLVKCDSGIGLANCTAMVVDLGGNVTVAGQASNALTYNIVRIRRANPTAVVGVYSCTPGTGFSLAPAVVGFPPYCYATLATGRQEIRDLQVIDGAAGANFNFFAGFLTLEGAVGTDGQPFFYRAVQGSAPITLGNWPNLNNGETFRGATLVQFRTVSPAKNFIVMTTSSGRVFSGVVPTSGTNYRTGATNLTLTPSLQGSCTSAPTAPPYRLRASVRTRTTYFTRGCAVVGHQPIMASNQNSISFNTSASLTWSTDFIQTGVAVSPGIEIDYRKDGCTEGEDSDDGTAYPNIDVGCVILPDNSAGIDANAFVAAKLSGVELVGTPSDWTVFQVKNLVDCRYLPVPRTGVCAKGLDPNTGEPTGAVIGSDGNPVANEVFDPTNQYLNITPLLPPEVTQATVLPAQMLLGPKFRARETLEGRTGRYRFDALFGIPQDGLQYEGTFQFTADIADLLGIPQPATGSRCGGQQLMDPTRAPEWDVVVNVSELVPTVGGPYLRNQLPLQPFSLSTTEYVGWLQNGEYCENPSGSIGVRGSAFMYGLELAPREQKLGPNGLYWYWPDSTYALLMRSLAKDLNDHIYAYTCGAGDGQIPLSAESCYQLLKDWVVTYPKLTKCVDATDKPKGSAGNEACTGFESQFAPFKTYVDGLPASPLTDPNNRIGELKARVGILSATYTKQFTPSIKAGGFTDPNM